MNFTFLQAPQVTQNGQMANILRLRRFAIASVYVHLVLTYDLLFAKYLTSFAVAFISSIPIDHQTKGFTRLWSDAPLSQFIH